MTNPTAHTDMPVLTATEQYLHTIRMRLEDAFAYLKIARHASVVCIAASKQTSTDCDEEVATVLFNIVSHHIDMQMRAISTIARWQIPSPGTQGRCKPAGQLNAQLSR